MVLERVGLPGSFRTESCFDHAHVSEVNFIHLTSETSPKEVGLNAIIESNAWAHKDVRLNRIPCHNRAHK